MTRGECVYADSCGAYENLMVQLSQQRMTMKDNPARYVDVNYIILA